MLGPLPRWNRRRCGRSGCCPNLTHSAIQHRMLVCSRVLTDRSVCRFNSRGALTEGSVNSVLGIPSWRRHRGWYHPDRSGSGYRRGTTTPRDRRRGSTTGYGGWCPGRRASSRGDLLWRRRYIAVSAALLCLVRCHLRPRSRLWQDVRFGRVETLNALISWKRRRRRQRKVGATQVHYAACPRNGVVRPLAARLRSTRHGDGSFGRSLHVLLCTWRTDRTSYSTRMRQSLPDTIASLSL